MQAVLKGVSSWAKKSSWGLLPFFGLFIETLTSAGRTFSGKELHERWTIIGCIVVAVVTALYGVFVYSFRSRLRTSAKVVLFLIALCACSLWIWFYICADPPSKLVFSHPLTMEALSLVAAFLSSLGFVVVLGFIVDGRQVCRRSWPTSSHE